MNGKTDDPMEQLKFIYALIILFLRIFSDTLIVFTRRRFGERYLTFNTLLPSFFLILIAAAFGSKIAEFVDVEVAQNIPSRALVIYGFGFMTLAIFHKLAAWQRRRKGTTWHSRSHGISHLSIFLPWSDSTLQRFIEPALAVILGIVITRTVSAPLGGFIHWSAFALFIVESHYARINKAQLLDMLDAQVESEYWTTAASQPNHPQEANGFVVSDIQYISAQARKEMAAASRPLDKSLQDLLTPPPKTE